MGLFFNNYNQGMSQRMSATVNGRKAQILRDSINLLKTTSNPDTFFYRYRFAEETAKKMAGAPDIVCNGMNATQIFCALVCDDTKDEFHKRFIDRMIAAHKENVLAYRMQDYGRFLTENARQYYVDRMRGKKFFFCKVRFYESGQKTYTYISKDRTILPGDTISIPTGSCDAPETKVLQVTDTFTAGLEDLEFPIERLRCIDGKLRNIACPRCGASITIDVTKKTGNCAYCSAEFYLV